MRPFARPDTMLEASETQSLPSIIGDALKRLVFAVQDYSLLTFQSITNIVTPPHYWFDALEQMDVIGVGIAADRRAYGIFYRRRDGAANSIAVRTVR